MTITPTQDEVNRVSSFSTASLLRVNFLGEVKNSLKERWIDPLSPDMKNLLYSGVGSVPFQYDGTEPITSISYRFYGTTSAWYIILYLNGYLHPDEIPAGAILNIPATSFIDNLLRPDSTVITVEEVTI